MRVLRLILSAPMMSFGRVTINTNRPSDPLPGRSMLTGLLANALGWDLVHDADRHQDLQDRLRYAAAQISDYPKTESDFATAFTSNTEKLWSSRGDKPDFRGGHTSSHRGGPVLMRKDYLADAQIAVALVLNGPSAQPDGPDLDALARALQNPARTLYIGRKTCLPDTPPYAGLADAPSCADALRDMIGPAGGFACWDPEQAPSCETTGEWTTRADLMDWTAHVHRGQSVLLQGHLTTPDAATTPPQVANDQPTGIQVRAQGHGDLHYARLVLPTRRLAAWLVRERLEHADFGYKAHAATRTALADHAPQPFRVAEEPGRIVVTGYTASDAHTLAAAAHDRRDGGLITEIETVSVPAVTPGLRVRYALDAVPVTRVRGRERDAYRGHGTRQDAYAAWLARKLDGILSLETTALETFEIRRLTRRDTHRGLRAVRLPVARLSGTAIVTDPAALRAALAHGIGRHTAFGAGCLALSRS